MNRGVDLSSQQARRFSPDDFERFDYVLAMDNDNYEILVASCPSGLESRLRLFMDFAPDLETREVPDPYYGGGSGFERVLDLIEQASEGLLTEIRLQHGL
jgi:protein-tyrosine phosphatase